MFRFPTWSHHKTGKRLVWPKIDFGENQIFHEEENIFDFISLTEKQDAYKIKSGKYTVFKSCMPYLFVRKPGEEKYKRLQLDVKKRNNGSLSAKETREQDLTMSKGSESLPRLEESSSDSEKDYELDDFDIIKTIGTGTFGQVCLCREKSTMKYGAMKILGISDIVRLKQVEHVKNEKSILEQVRHPFIVSLWWSWHDRSCLYMLFDYVCGGELFSYLRNYGRFSVGWANFYSCEVISALEYLHAQNVVYRDLKPENLILDQEGHLKIIDFGFAKKLADRTWTLCGTPEYLAPEIIQSKGHNRAVDWWALGVLIYEMLAGHPPFFDSYPFGIYEKILAGKIEWSRQFDPVAKDLVKKLLVQDRTKRLGNMKNGAEDVKRHRWFKEVDWSEVYRKQLKPPIIPVIKYEGDTANFDSYPESDWKSKPSVGETELKLFEDF